MSRGRVMLARVKQTNAISNLIRSPDSYEAIGLTF